MNEITVKQALNVMCQVVGEFGVDYVYTMIDGACHNWDVEKDCPSCLVGHVLHRLGVSGEFLRENTMKGVGNVAHHLGEIFPVEAGVVQVLGVAQYAQDSGESWGSALGKALAEYRRQLEIPA